MGCEGDGTPQLTQSNGCFLEFGSSLREVLESEEDAPLNIGGEWILATKPDKFQSEVHAVQLHQEALYMSGRDLDITLQGAKIGRNSRNTRCEGFVLDIPQSEKVANTRF